MREVTVRAMVTDSWDSAVPQLLVTWYDERGRTYGARLLLTEGIPEPLAPTPPPPPPDPIKAKFPALTDADVAWVREQQTLALTGGSTANPTEATATSGSAGPQSRRGTSSSTRRCRC